MYKLIYFIWKNKLTSTNRLIITQETYRVDKRLIDKYTRYDAYIVGSNQVCNKKITNNSEVFFLNFLKNEIKISYAASFEKDDLSEEEVDNISKYLPKF